MSLKEGMPRHKRYMFANLTVSVHVAFCGAFSVQSPFCSVAAGSTRWEGTWVPGSVMFNVKVIFCLNFSLHHWAVIADTHESFFSFENTYHFSSLESILNTPIASYICSFTSNMLKVLL